MSLLKPSISIAAVAATLLLAASPAAAGSCVNKAAEGTGSDEKAAKFQVDEALLQAVDWGAWASWMANGTTPGYSYGPRKYKCSKGGLGVTCVGQAKICKLG
ncbi:MAG: hypothetical protein ACK4MF_10275 [Hyphomicrobiaceae bacterium]